VAPFFAETHGQYHVLITRNQPR